MRILGHKRIKVRERHVLVGTDEEGNDVTLLIRAMRLGLSEQVEDELPDPTPPLGQVERDARTNMPKRDASGRPIQTKLYEDPEYLKRLGRISFLRSVAMVYYSLAEGQVEWEAVREEKTGEEFFQEIINEMEDAGIGIGAMTNLATAMNELSSVSSSEMDDARHAIEVKDEAGKPTEHGRTGS